RVAEIVAGVADVLNLRGLQLGVSNRHRSDVLHYHHATGRVHEKMRLSRDDQGEGLQRRSDINFRIDQNAAAPLNLPQIVNVAVRRDGPKYKCRVNAAEFVRAREILQTQLDARAPASLPPNLSSAFQTRQTRRSVKSNFDRLV